MKKINKTYLFFWFLGGLILLFVLAPLLGMFLDTKPVEIFQTVKDKEVISSIWLTIWTAISATFIFSIAAIPFAWILARKKFLLKNWVLAIIDLPVVIPHTAAGIALLGFVSRDSVLGKIADSLGFSFIGHPAGIIIAMAFVSLPFLLNAARSGFEAVPEHLEKTALSLGASPVRVFFTISLPLAWDSILSGLIMMWARGMSEFGAVIILVYHPMVAPTLIYERFGAFGLSYARPVAAILILFCLLFFFVLRYLSSKHRQHA
jgi:molybdate/tungstate transport system permease protein